ncbi:MAG: phosphatidate cytidylyltransferase [Planctomycetota bacterium]
MLKHRIPSGILMTAGLATLIWADDAAGRNGLPPGTVLLGLLLLVGVLAANELAALLNAKGRQVSRLSLSLAAASGCLLIYFLPMLESTRTAGAVIGSVAGAVLFFAFCRHSLLSKKTEGAAAAGANAVFAMVYLGVLPGIYLLIRDAGYSAWAIAAIVMTVKSCDIGAYFTGRFLGRRKLIEWLSPGKTWEGLIGGMLFAGLWAVVFTQIGNRYTPESAIPVWYALLGGMLLGFLGQVGDLVASLLKRDAGAKDWAQTIPGFGGVMDVVDSILLAAPAVYLLLIFSR